VRTDSIDLGEGFFTLGTVIFPRDASKRVEIVWKDSVAQRSPQSVRVHLGASVWRTPSGVAVGTTLRELERINGGPFRLFGLAFDGSGVVFSWAGRLATPADAPCRFGAAVSDVDASSDSLKGYYRQVLGDREFSSGHPAFQHLNPRVSEMWLDYRQQPPPHQ
jgi:hypothetical protein